MIKTYKYYLIKTFSKSILTISGVFFGLILILNIFEEINYFKDLEISIFFPILLNFLNAPSILFNIFPFIFLISSQLFILKLIENNELIIFKNFGFDYLKLISLFTLISFIFSLIIVLIFYNFSSKLKFTYLDLKSDYSSDDKYLAVITENGLWIRDNTKDNINIINADSIMKDSLNNVTITQFDSNYNLRKYIYSDLINIKNNIWEIKRGKISENNTLKNIDKTIYFESNFNYNKINTLFSNLESLTLWQLIELRKDYKTVGYSDNEINIHLQKLYSYPFYLTIMSMLAIVITLNFSSNKTKLFYIFVGIFLSAFVFYINHFADLLAKNQKLPVELSIWTPHLLMLIIVCIGLVRINEK